MSSTITALTSGGGLAMAGDTSGQLELKTNNGTTAVTIDTSQNVGVGTTPSAWNTGWKGLNVSTAGVASSGATGFLTNNTYQNTSGNWVYTSASYYPAYYAQSGGSGAHIWYNCSSLGSVGATATLNESMRIDSSGNVGIGAASGGAAIYIEKAQDSMLNLNATGGYNPLIEFKRAGTRYGYFQPTVNDFRIAAENTTNGLVITAGGSGGVKLTNTATSWVSNSDITLKNVTGTYETPLADIAQIEAIKFTWKSDETNRPQVGVSAQSVQKVIPEAVEADNEGILGVRYTEIIPLLIASIQELNAKVEAQATEIKALKGVA